MRYLTLLFLLTSLAATSIVLARQQAKDSNHTPQAIARYAESLIVTVGSGPVRKLKPPYPTESDMEKAIGKANRRQVQADVMILSWRTPDGKLLLAANFAPGDGARLTSLGIPVTDGMEIVARSERGWLRR